MVPRVRTKNPTGPSVLECVIIAMALHSNPKYVSHFHGYTTLEPVFEEPLRLSTNYQTLFTPKHRGWNVTDLPGLQPNQQF